jgi:hypothetical protein
MGELRVEITRDYLATGLIDNEEGWTWSQPVPGGATYGPLVAEVYDDDDEHYFTIRVTGVPEDDNEDELYRVHCLFERGWGATSVRYRGHPELDVG